MHAIIDESGQFITLVTPGENGGKAHKIQTKIKVVNADTSMLQDTSQILDTSVNDGDVIDLRRPSLFLSNKDKTNTANMFGAGGSFDASASPSSSPPSRSTPIAPPTPNLGGQNTGFGGNMFADANDNSFTNDTPNAMNAGPEDNNTSLIGLNANIMGEGAD